MELKTGVANGEAPAIEEGDVAAGYEAMVAAAERHAQAIVREAEEEACRILEDAARVAVKVKAKAAAPRPRRWAVLTLLLAGCALAAAIALVVGIAVGQM
jgi:cell division septum initiation protein DivIVA